MIIRSFLRGSVKQLVKSSSWSQYSLLESPKVFYSKAENSEKSGKSDSMDQFGANPFFDKYKDQLKAAYKENPDEFKEKLKETRNSKWGKSATPSPPSSPTQPKKNYKFTKTRTLDTLMKTEMLKDLSTEEISHIWKSYHSKRDRLGAIIPVATYDKMHARSAEYATFIFPLPRKEGFEFFLAQWSGNECHFTPLVNYQAYGDNAPAVMTVIHFEELRDHKSVILMMAEVDVNNLKIIEAHCLVNQMEMYYAGDDAAKIKLLEKFNKTPDSFKHMELIHELGRHEISFDSLKTSEETTKKSDEK